MENIIITNKRKFEKLKKEFIKDGLNKIHVISDFDRSLTQAFVNKKYIPSISAIIREENILGKKYSNEAFELLEYYHKIEIDTRIPLNEKIKFMEDWWEKSMDLFIKYDLNKNKIQKIINSKKIKLRNKTKDIILFLNQNKVPLIILSASGIGYDSISFYLKNKKLFSENIFVISNKLIWNKNGKTIDCEKPLIHAFNKNKFSVKNYDFYYKIKDRKNVILIGDSLGDVNMNEKFKHQNIIKIGFLNFNVEKDLKEYKKVYDVVIINDSSMEFVYRLLKEIKN
jgi:cytosolic 5'-nucleotidase 3